MGQRLRSHLNYANVMATVAVFLVLGGGTAFAAYVISSNSQVGPNTISGHKPPAGAHANVIGGSLNAQDLALGAVTGSRLANASVGTSKLNLPRIDFSGSDGDAPDGAPHHTVLTLDGVTVGVSCTFAMPPTTGLNLFVSSSSGGTLRGSYSTGPEGAATPSMTATSVSSTPSWFATDVSSAGADYLAGEFTYRNANRVIGILLDGSANFATHSCDLHGTAVPAPN